MEMIRNLPTENIELSPLNPRKTIEFSSLDELAQSISEVGVLQPVIVRQVPNKDKFELVCGERRLRASEKAGLKTIPAIVKAELSDEAALDMMITENLQRKDVHPLEESEAFNQLMINMNYDVAQLVQRFGKSEQYIRQRLKLNDLIDDFKQLFRKEIIGIGHAFEISKLQSKYQQELFDDDFKERDKYWTCPTVKMLKNTIDRNFTTKLADAVFDLTDNTLNKKTGACIDCPNNTASNRLLFPEDEVTGTCLDISCFRHKTELYIDKEVERISNEQPDILLMRPNWIYNERDIKRVERLEKKGYKIVTDDPYFEISEPQEPEKPSEEDYNFPEDKEEFEAHLEEYLEELEQYREDYKEYQETLTNPDNVKAFMVAGKDVGRIVLFETRKGYISSLLADDNTPEGKIKKLQEKDKRNKEIVLEKIHEAAKSLLRDSEYYKRHEPLSEIETKALMATMINNFDEDMAKLIYGENIERYWYVEDEVKINAINTMSVEKRNQVMRFRIQKELSFASSSVCRTFLYEVTKMLFPDELDEVMKKQQAIYEKRKVGIENKIEQLKSEIDA